MNELDFSKHCPPDADKKQKIEDFIELVDDILLDERYQELALFKHHSSSILRHCLEVGYLSYCWGTKLSMDDVALARGGVLHDFFLYDWRSDRFHYSLHDFKNSHAFRHPKIALHNAEECFALSATEKDVILNHMWPATVKLPKTKETYLVCAVDKYTACREYLIKQRQARDWDRILGEHGIHFSHTL